MTSVVAVAGGTGGLGRAIVEPLVSSGKFQVLVFSREASESKSKELGAKVVAVDYDNVDSIVKALQDNKVDTLISTVGTRSGLAPELALIEAASKSTVTKRYIPSTWGIKYTPELVPLFPLAKGKIQVLETLAASSLEYTAVVNGFFLDYWGAPYVKTHLSSLTLFIDIANKAAAIPGSGNVPVTFSYSFDIGKFVAALLTQSNWEKESYVIGDKVTGNEFLAIAEEARGAKFDTAYDSVEKLKTGQVTELPGHKALYPFFPKEALQGMCASFGILFEEGFFDFKPAKSLNDQFPDIKPKTVKDLVGEAWKGK